MWSSQYLWMFNYPQAKKKGEFKMWIQIRNSKNNTVYKINLVCDNFWIYSVIILLLASLPREFMLTNTDLTVRP